MTDETMTRRTRTIPGHWVVLVLAGFGILSTSTMWVYWHFHTAPFVPLQRALDEEFPGSAPRVEGGQRKMHKGGPRILRIVMKVDFDPNTDVDAVDPFVDRVLETARKNFTMDDYDEAEVHLYWPEPEKEIQQVTRTRDLVADEG